MSEEKRTRRRFTIEEKKTQLEIKAQVFDQKAEEYKKKAADVRAQIAELDKPTVTVKDVNARIKELGIAPEDVMKALDRIAAKK